ATLILLLPIPTCLASIPTRTLHDALPICSCQLLHHQACGPGPVPESRQDYRQFLAGHCQTPDRCKVMSEKTIRILLVEDNAGDARLLREMLNEPGSLKIELTHLGCMSEAVHHLAASAVNIILLDLGLPDAQGLGAVRQAHAVAPSVPLVV